MVTLRFLFIDEPREIQNATEGVLGLCIRNEFVRV